MNPGHNLRLSWALEGCVHFGILLSDLRTIFDKMAILKFLIWFICWKMCRGRLTALRSFWLLKIQLERSISNQVSPPEAYTSIPSIRTIYVVALQSVFALKKWTKTFPFQTNWTSLKYIRASLLYELYMPQGITYNACPRALWGCFDTRVLLSNFWTIFNELPYHKILSDAFWGKGAWKESGASCLLISHKTFWTSCEVVKINVLITLWLRRGILSFICLKWLGTLVSC